MASTDNNPTPASATLSAATQQLLDQARQEMRLQEERLAKRDAHLKDNAEADEFDRKLLHVVNVLATEQMQLAKVERDKPLKALQKEIDDHDRRFGTNSGIAPSQAPAQLPAAPGGTVPSQPRRELVAKVNEYYVPVQVKANELDHPKLHKLLHEFNRDPWLPDFGAMLAVAGFQDEDQLRKVLGVSGRKQAKTGPTELRLGHALKEWFVGGSSDPSDTDKPSRLV